MAAALDPIVLEPISCTEFGEKSWLVEGNLPWSWWQRRLKRLMSHGLIKEVSLESESRDLWKQLRMGSRTNLFVLCLICWFYLSISKFQEEAANSALMHSLGQVDEGVSSNYATLPRGGRNPFKNMGSRLVERVRRSLSRSSRQSRDSDREDEIEVQVYKKVKAPGWFVIILFLLAWETSILTEEDQKEVCRIKSSQELV